MHSEELTDLKTGEKKHVIAVCRYAGGDEDIPPNVRGIRLKRPRTHFSHLGVRARQVGVVVVCAEFLATFEKIWPKSSLTVSIVVNERERLISIRRGDGWTKEVRKAGSGRRGSESG